MWIRSQDKTRLIDANYIRVNGVYIEAMSFGTYAIIGEYSSQEKALKVIDRIEKELNKGELIEQVDGRMYHKHKNTVIQMPLDIEVEEEELI